MTKKRLMVARREERRELGVSEGSSVASTKRGYPMPSFLSSEVAARRVLLW